MATQETATLTESNSQVSILATLGKDCGSIVIPSGIHQQNYVIMAHSKYYDVSTYQKITCICKYDVTSNIWNKIALNLHSNMVDLKGYGVAALDKTKKTIYYFADNLLNLIPLNGDQINRINAKNIDKIETALHTSLFHNDALFVIDGESSSIQKYDIQNQKFIKYAEMCNGKNTGLFGVIDDNKRDCLFLFGGYDYTKREILDNIVQFNWTTKNCCTLSVKLPQKRMKIHCLMAIRNQYVLLFGGLGSSADCSGYSDDIYVYSIKHQTIRKSKMKCPLKGLFTGITVSDSYKDEKAVFGFVRKECKIFAVDDHYFPPFELLHLIHSYYLTEYVCLLEKLRKKHYKISTFDIVSLV